MEIPICANTILALSSQLFCFTADTIPNGTDISKAQTSPITESSNVAGNAVFIISMTGVL